MTRKGILGKENSFKDEPAKGRREYIPPENGLVDLKLVNILMEHYFSGEAGKNIGRATAWSKETINSVVHTLESIIKDTTSDLQAQLLIDTLKVMLWDETASELTIRRATFTRTEYLTLVIQALYNQAHGSEFVVDMRDCSDIIEMVSWWHLDGRPDRPLSIKVYGNFTYLSLSASYSNLTFHGNLTECMSYGEHCHFTIRGDVGLWDVRSGDSDFDLYGEGEYFVSWPERCTFNIMPGAQIKMNGAKHYKGNVLRKLDEKDEVISILNEKGEWVPLG